MPVVKLVRTFKHFNDAHDYAVKVEDNDNANITINEYKTCTVVTVERKGIKLE